MNALVEPVLHINGPAPLAIRIEEPLQLLNTEMPGATGTILGDAIADPAALVQPVTVAVTLNNTLLLTVIELVVAPPGDHTRDPVAVVASMEYPQVLTTVIAGADGAAEDETVIKFVEVTVSLPSLL